MNKKNEGEKTEKRSLDFWLKENKETVLRLLVIVLSLAILFLWLSNLKNVWRPLSETADGQNWQELKVILNEPLDDKSVPTSSSDALISEPDNSIDNQQETIFPEAETGEENKKEIDDLLKELLEEANKKAENLPIGLDCPEWINCMPSFDSPPRACQIPPGCEGVTQIAY